MSRSPRLATMTTPNHYKSRITIERLHEAVADMNETETVCTTVLPKGVPIQLIYENFVLECIYGNEGECVELTELLLSHVPQFIESDYLHATCDGDFELTGRLWLSKEHLAQLNGKLISAGLPQYPDTRSAVRKFLERDTPIPFSDMLLFTPDWSTELFGSSIFGAYEEFLTVMGNSFPIPDHLTTSVRAIDNVITFYERIKQLQAHATEHSAVQQTPEPDAVVVFRNDVTRVSGAFTNTGDATVAEIEFSPAELRAVLDRIILGPDRFGRIRPMIIADETTASVDDTLTVMLQTPEDLLVKDYHEGDVVRLEFNGSIPRLGAVVQKTTTPRHSARTGWREYHDHTCNHCYQPLSQRNGSFFCDNPYCTCANYYRLLHACHSRVLDIPITHQNLAHLYAGFEEESTPITALLNTSRHDLCEVIWDECIDATLEIITNRHNQLYGRGYSPDVKFFAQGRFLDALSLNGLYQSNIRKLQKGLETNALYWEELPDILSSERMLISLKIPIRDAREITASTIRHIDEVVAFSKL